MFMTFGVGLDGHVPGLFPMERNARLCRGARFGVVDVVGLPSHDVSVGAVAEGLLKGSLYTGEQR